MFTIEISPSSFQDTQFTCIGCELAIKNEGRILELHVQLVIPMNGESCSKDASIFLLDVEFPSSSLRPHRPRCRRGRTPLLVGWRLAGMEQDAGEVEPGLELEGGQEVAVLVHVLGAAGRAYCSSRGSRTVLSLFLHHSVPRSLICKHPIGRPWCECEDISWCTGT